MERVGSSLPQISSPFQKDESVFITGLLGGTHHQLLINHNLTESVNKDIRFRSLKSKENVHKKEYRPACIVSDN